MVNNAEKAGQLLFIGLPNESVSRNVAILNELKPGGLILFSRNISTLEQTVNELNTYRQNPKMSYPLLVGIDQEGGRVSRLPEAFATKFPTAAALGRRASSARAIAKAMGDELYALGINLNFAPVLDINSNPHNPVIGDRSYGSTVASVWTSGQQVLLGLIDAGIIPVAKHFPGHGDTSTDSHKAVAIVSANEDLLESREIEPFHQAIKALAPAVMLGHLLVPALDSQHLTTVSKAIVSGLLRQKLGFNGVVLTDDLEMGAINQDDIGEIAVQAILAGADLLLVCHSFAKQLTVRNALLAAIESGRISAKRLEQSLNRILALKERYRINKSPVDIGQARKVVGAVQHRQLASAINLGL